MYFCIDSGNSRTKCVIYNAKGATIDSKQFDENSFTDLYGWILDKNIIHAIFSNTGKKVLDKSRIEIPGIFIELNHETPLPIQIIYSTPETLGLDRIAGACGAHALYPSKNCLIIDAGTCMTMDLMLSTG